MKQSFKYNKNIKYAYHIQYYNSNILNDSVNILIIRNNYSHRGKKIIIVDGVLTSVTCPVV